MTDGRFAAFFNRVHAHPGRVLLSVAIALSISVAGLFFIPFWHSMDIMLPAGSDTQQAVLFLQNIDFSAKVAISLSQTDNTLDRAGFFSAVDQFSRSIDSPLISKALSTFDEQQMIRDMGAFLNRAPELLSEPELAQLGSRISSEGVARSLRAKYLQLIKPEGSFMSAMIQRDPLDIQMMLIEKLRGLSASFGYTMHIEQNHLVSADGKQILLILETSVPFTDAPGSRRLVDYLNGQISKLPPSIHADLICGHLHTLSNEKVIKHDVQLTVSISSAVFILLFLFFFKDSRAMLIFGIPFAALLVGVNITAVLMGTLSPMMLGFGSVIAGIAVDYGIHVYVAVRRSRTVPEAVQSVARPVLFGALTTAGVFAAFFFSSIPGYHQLAGFALISVLLSAAGALLVLPVFLVPKNLRSPFPTLGKIPLRRAWLIAVLFFALLAAAVPVALHVRFDSDIMRLDGTEKAVLQTEQKFQETWGTGGAGQAVAVVSGSDEETALERNDLLYDRLTQTAGPAEVASLSAIWKSRMNREANAMRWSTFWNPARVTELKGLFRTEGTPFGFAPDAFDPFFQTLEKPVVPGGEPQNNAVFEQFKSRFVQHSGGETRLLTFFPDQPEFIKSAAAVKKEIPGLMLISRSAISAALAHDYTREFVRISVIAISLVLLVSALLLKNLRQIFIVLMPACAGVASVSALVALTGSALNVMNLGSGIIVIGLCVDYGIFYVHSYMHSLDLGTQTSVTLSAGTTLVGAGALLFTLHPALFSVGLTLVGGISAGYVTAMLVVPALCRLLLKEAE